MAVELLSDLLDLLVMLLHSVHCLFSVFIEIPLGLFHFDIDHIQQIPFDFLAKMTIFRRIFVGAQSHPRRSLTA